MPTPRRALCWLRRDLRLSDHTPLYEATQFAASVAVLFVFDTEILNRLQDRNDRRVVFIHRSLQELDEKLRGYGSKLLMGFGDPVDVVPRFAADLRCDAVFAGRDYEPYAIQRDAKVEAKLAAMGVQFQTSKDSVIFEGGEVLSQTGSPLRVYTPYAKAWKTRFSPEQHADERKPHLEHLMPTADLLTFDFDWGLASLGFTDNELWLDPGEEAGLARLQTFRNAISAYGDNRDFPAKSGTSGLSVHLRFGTVSIREAIRLALGVGDRGAEKWLGELIWRDFYQDILFHHPDVVSQTFQPQFRDLDYPGEESWFQAWIDGLTGYPIVDAAMRCFKSTGWMHNRLRMVVASFLTKDLLIDYRRGEAYFARYLLDFDLASNNGGWQWAASVGADPQPYFRIFNPILQSAKFDPEGEFIRQWLPELAELDAPAIHFPSQATPMELLVAGIELGKDYPYPLVNHAVQRDKAIALLAAAKSTD